MALNVERRLDALELAVIALYTFGESAGHEFRGNQYTSGSVGTGMDDNRVAGAAERIAEGQRRFANLKVGDSVPVHRYGKDYSGTVTSVSARGVVKASFVYGNGKVQTAKVEHGDLAPAHGWKVPAPVNDQQAKVAEGRQRARDATGRTPAQQEAGRVAAEKHLIEHFKKMPANGQAALDEIAEREVALRH